MATSKKENKCASCVHFKNKQMLLNYSDSSGICTNSAFNFNTTTGRLVGVLDLKNLRDRTKCIGNTAHDFESFKTTVKESQYLLQVEEDFGCIYHTK